MKVCYAIFLTLLAVKFGRGKGVWKQKHHQAETREFPELELSEDDRQVLRMFKDQNLLNALLDDEDVNENTTADVRKFGWKIFPGTHWCGKGHIANSDEDEDLGVFSKIDSCCRTHDKCPRNLETGEKGYGAVNTGEYTASDCKCDAHFKKCLKAVPKGKWWHVKTRLEYGSAHLIGKMFFNLLKFKCLKFQDENAPASIQADDNGEADTAEEKAVLVDQDSFRRK